MIPEESPQAKILLRSYQEAHEEGMPRGGLLYDQFGNPCPIPIRQAEGRVVDAEQDWDEYVQAVEDLRKGATQ